jgi:hypothetical protein
METIIINKGTRQVVITRPVGADIEAAGIVPRYSCRLYVANGEVITLTSNVVKTEKGARRWAERVLSA